MCRRPRVARRAAGAFLRRCFRIIIVDARFASSVRCALTNTKPHLRVRTMRSLRVIVAMSEQR
jgi:hypothetical protein